MWLAYPLFANTKLLQLRLSFILHTSSLVVVAHTTIFRTYILLLTIIRNYWATFWGDNKRCSDVPASESFHFFLFIILRLQRLHTQFELLTASLTLLWFISFVFVVNVHRHLVSNNIRIWLTYSNGLFRWRTNNKCDMKAYGMLFDCVWLRFFSLSLFLDNKQRKK